MTNIISTCDVLTHSAFSIVVYLGSALDSLPPLNPDVLILVQFFRGKWPNDKHPFEFGAPLPLRLRNSGSAIVLEF